MTLSRVILWGLVGFLVFTWPPSDSRAQRPDEPCSCKKQDKTDVEDRIKKLTEADKEYDKLIKHWQQQPKTKLTESLRQTEQSKVNTAMAKVQDANATRLTKHLGNTNQFCESWVSDEAGPCLRRALQDHENKHKFRCDQHKDPGIKDVIEKGPGVVMDWRRGQTIVEYLQEEKQDHLGEVAILKAELDKMNKQCQQFTELDLYGRLALDQVLAQRERMNQAEKRLDEYGESLN